jgi:endonuclease-3
VLGRPPGSIGTVAEPERPPLSRSDPIGERAPEVIRILGETYPDASIALRFTNPLELMVDTILSAQCTDAKVNEVTDSLFQNYSTPEDYVRVPEDELKADIKPTGFFNQKALSIREACRRIVEVYDGKVVGIPVDTHVRRLANRIWFSAHADPDKIEQDLMRLVPEDRWYPFSYELIDHGRALCTAKKPRCTECPIEYLCPSSQA